MIWSKYSREVLEELLDLLWNAQDDKAKKELICELVMINNELEKREVIKSDT